MPRSTVNVDVSENRTITVPIPTDDSSFETNKQFWIRVFAFISREGAAGLSAITFYQWDEGDAVPFTRAESIRNFIARLTGISRISIAQRRGPLKRRNVTLNDVSLINAGNCSQIFEYNIVSICAKEPQAESTAVAETQTGRCTPTHPYRVYLRPGSILSISL